MATPFFCNIVRQLLWTTDCMVILMSTKSQPIFYYGDENQTNAVTKHRYYVSYENIIASGVARGRGRWGRSTPGGTFWGAAKLRLYLKIWKV